MSERKVLNKYYPPEFDPSKIPRLKGSNKRTGVFSIRVMAPFNMRCNTCGEYIYKGKKFNSRKENVDDEDYLGLRIFRFYIRCPRCVAEIAFKTDLENTDYTCEAGATRLFEAERLARKMDEEERKQQEADEMNPMKVLENRTKASRNEMDQIDRLEELREINAKKAAVDHENMLKEHMVYEEQLLKLQEEEEDKMVKSILKQGTSGQMIRRIDDTEGYAVKRAKIDTSTAPTDILADGPSTSDEKPKESWQKSVGSFSKKVSLSSLVKRKTPGKPTETASSSAPASSPSIAEEPSTTSTKTTQVVAASSSSSAASTSTSSASSSSKPTGLGALGMLGGYSDSESGGDSD